MLKALTGTLFISFISLSLQAQEVKKDSMQELTIDDLTVKPMRLPALAEVGGSIFLNADYKPAQVLISPDKIVMDVPVKFNVFNNAVMIQKDGMEMRLEQFYEVDYDETAPDGSTRHVRFKQGYPDADNHTNTSVYQVLSEGPKVHLLKYMTQKVEDAATLGDYSRRELVTTEQLYLYVPGDALKKIKSVKKDLAEILPAMAAKIDEIVSANNLKLKNESEISLLVESLNKP
ncbi:MAG: hypothetical protein NTW29_20205 [Bacteroidetes bacterium]|nr:hypothetical protein [Bacteroidota bacterium]